VLGGILIVAFYKILFWIPQKQLTSLWLYEQFLCALFCSFPVVLTLFSQLVLMNTSFYFSRKHPETATQLSVLLSPALGDTMSNLNG